MKKYIQIKEWYITDCITYKHWDYIEIETDENINISWFQTYSNWEVWIDETKKAEIEEVQRLAQEEQEKGNTESEKNSLKDTIIKQLRDIEERWIKKRAEYFAAEMIEDEALRGAKIAKIVVEWQEIANEYKAIVSLLQNDFWLNLSEII